MKNIPEETREPIRGDAEAAEVSPEIDIAFDSPSASITAQGARITGAGLGVSPVERYQMDIALGQRGIEGGDFVSLAADDTCKKLEGGNELDQQLRRTVFVWTDLGAGKCPGGNP